MFGTPKALTFNVIASLSQFQCFQMFLHHGQIDNSNICVAH